MSFIGPTPGKNTKCSIIEDSTTKWALQHGYIQRTGSDASEVLSLTESGYKRGADPSDINDNCGHKLVSWDIGAYEPPVVMGIQINGVKGTARFETEIDLDQDAKDFLRGSPFEGSLQPFERGKAYVFAKEEPMPLFEDAGRAEVFGSAIYEKWDDGWRLVDIKLGE